MFKKTWIALAFCLALTACSEKQSEQKRTNQEEFHFITIVPNPNYWFQLENQNPKENENLVDENFKYFFDEFKNGSMVAYLPESWGNQRLPLLFVQYFCDTNYQVIQNDSGVICTYTDVRLHKWYDGYKKVKAEAKKKDETKQDTSSSEIPQASDNNKPSSEPANSQ